MQRAHGIVIKSPESPEQRIKSVADSRRHSIDPIARHNRYAVSISWSLRALVVKNLVTIRTLFVSGIPSHN